MSELATETRACPCKVRNVSRGGAEGAEGGISREAAKAAKEAKAERKRRPGVTIIRGECPVCGGEIAMALGTPRDMTPKAKPLHPLEAFARQLFGFGWERKPSRPLGVLAAVLLVCCMALAGCASTTVRNAAGQTVFRTQGDGVFEFHGADGSSLVATINHSQATIAAGNASAVIADSVGRGVVGGLIASKSAGLLPAVSGGIVSAIPTKAVKADAETRGLGDAEGKAKRLEAASTKEGNAQ